jgi:hypothetical protein
LHRYDRIWQDFIQILQAPVTTIFICFSEWSNFRDWVFVVSDGEATIIDVHTRDQDHDYLLGGDGNIS